MEISSLVKQISNRLYMSYQSNYELATSDNMSTIRTILLNDNPATGPTIISDQQAALNAVNGTASTKGLWAQYRNLQDQTLNKLQAFRKQTSSKRSSAEQCI